MSFFLLLGWPRLMEILLNKKEAVRVGNCFLLFNGILRSGWVGKGDRHLGHLSSLLSLVGVIVRPLPPMFLLNVKLCHEPLGRIPKER